MILLVKLKHSNVFIVVFYHEDYTKKTHPMFCEALRSTYSSLYYVCIVDV